MEKDVPVKTGSRRKRQDQHAGKQNESQDPLRHLHKLFLPDQEETHQDQHKDREGDLPGINDMLPDPVLKSDSRGLCKDDSRDDKKRRCIQKNDRKIGKAQKPGGQKRVVAPECLLRVVVDPSLAGTMPHQPRVVIADHQHQRSAQQHRDQGPRRSCQRQECRGRHDKSAPADTAAESNRPHVGRRQITCHFPPFDQRFFLRFFLSSHYAVSPIRSPSAPVTIQESLRGSPAIPISIS